MVCQACGGPVAGPATFCPHCGAPVPAAPYSAPPPPMLFVPRVQRNLQTVGILWCAYGAFRLMSGLVGMVLLHVVAGGYNPWAFAGPPGRSPIPAHWMAVLVPIVAVYTIIISTLSLLVGFGLLNRKPWGRTVAMVVGVLALLRPVLGTALGIYTLWVLGPASSAAEYDAIAERA